MIPETSRETVPNWRWWLEACICFGLGFCLSLFFFYPGFIVALAGVTVAATAKTLRRRQAAVSALLGVAGAVVFYIIIFLIDYII